MDSAAETVLRSAGKAGQTTRVSAATHAGGLLHNAPVAWIAQDAGATGQVSQLYCVFLQRGPFRVKRGWRYG